jgi:hypothetical protein
MQDKIIAEKPSTPSGASRIDPEKIADFIKKYIKGSQ